MRRAFPLATLLAACVVGTTAWGGQAPGPASAPDLPVSHRDRVYAAEQFSNTVSVTDPADNKLLGVIRLGDPQPGNLSPLYRGEVLVHGLGFANVLAELGLPPDALAVSLIGFNLGVEAGQLVIVSAILPLAFFCRRSLLYPQLVLGAGSASIVAIAFVWLIERGFNVNIFS